MEEIVLEPEPNILDVGAAAGAKTWDAWSLKFKFRLHSPGFNYVSNND